MEITQRDARTVVGVLHLDAEPASWSRLVRAALTRVTGLVVTSLDDEQGFLAPRGQHFGWLNGGVQLEFDGPTVTATHQAPLALSTTRRGVPMGYFDASRSPVRALLEAVVAAAGGAGSAGSPAAGGAAAAASPDAGDAADAEPRP